MVEMGSGLCLFVQCVYDFGTKFGGTMWCVLRVVLFGNKSGFVIELVSGRV